MKEYMTSLNKRFLLDYIIVASKNMELMLSLSRFEDHIWENDI